MSKMAKLESRKFKHVKDATRMIICEQAFDVRIGELVIIAYHPKSKTLLPLLRELLPSQDSREFDLALRKAIWNEALKRIPSKLEKTTGQREAVFAAQPGLFG